MKPSILIVDDERAFLDSVLRLLRIQGFEDVTAVEDPRDVAGLLEQRAFDAAFLDITMPHLDGLAVLKIIKEARPQTECIMVTANESIPSVVQAIRLGAYDYLVKPVRPDQLTHALTRALERKHLVESLVLRSELAASRSLRQPEAFRDITTCSRDLLRLLHEAELHAASTIPVLVTGETGVGKELLARAVHRASQRADRPFVAVNMLALSPTLFESEFFGHARGAFTGADRERAGYLAQARGGTLFLDEIGDLSLEIQGKLLRVLQEGEYTPVGKTRPELADVRFVAATNQDLQKLVQQRRFRKDLYFRLQFAHLHIPPLREREDDVPLLAASFLESSSRPDVALSDAALELLVSHDWPGNVRELKGTLEAAANLAEEGVIEPGHLRVPRRPARRTATKVAATKDVMTESGEIEPLAAVERRHVLAVYEALANNKTQAARALGIGLQTLHRKLKVYGVK